MVFKKGYKSQKPNKPPEYNPVKRAAADPKSRAKAIAAMCAHCMGCNAQHLETGFRDHIRDCTATNCPLHPHRPFQNRQKKESA